MAASYFCPSSRSSSGPLSPMTSVRTSDRFRLGRERRDLGSACPGSSRPSNPFSSVTVNCITWPVVPGSTGSPSGNGVGAVLVIRTVVPFGRVREVDSTMARSPGARVSSVISTGSAVPAVAPDLDEGHGGLGLVAGALGLEPERVEPGVRAVVDVEPVLPVVDVQVRPDPAVHQDRVAEVLGIPVRVDVGVDPLVREPERAVRVERAVLDDRHLVLARAGGGPRPARSGS